LLDDSLYIGFEENLETIFIVNGYSKTKNIFYKNNRVKEIKFSIFIGVNKSGYVSEICIFYDAIKFERDTIIQLEDTMVPQEIAFQFNWEEVNQFKKVFFADVFRKSCKGIGRFRYKRG
jgi:hypothetical protein